MTITMKIIATLLLTVMTGMAVGQSLKSNTTLVVYKIPKKGELIGYKTYQVKLLTKELILTDDEVKLAGDQTNVDIKNNEKKIEWANHYLGHISKGFTWVDENANADILILLEITDFGFKDLSTNMAGAQSEESPDHSQETS